MAVPQSCVGAMDDGGSYFDLVPAWRMPRSTCAGSASMPCYSRVASNLVVFLMNLLPKWVCHSQRKCDAEATSEEGAGKPVATSSPRNIDVT